MTDFSSSSGPILGQIQMKFDTFNELIQILKIWGLTFFSWCDIIYGLFDQMMTALLVTTAAFFAAFFHGHPNSMAKVV